VPGGLKEDFFTASQNDERIGSGWRAGLVYRTGGGAEHTAAFNRVAWLDDQTRLVDQQNERILLERKLVEIEAARRALEPQLAQTRSGFERQVLSDLTDAQKKAVEFRQDFIKAQQKTDEQLLRAPIDRTVQQLALHTVGGVVTPAQQSRGLE
jgi:hypothetical protein